MERLFLFVLNMTMTASYVIAAVCVVRLLLKKAPKAISYALWGVVGFRLIFPFSFESVYSLLPINSTSIPQSIIYQTVPRIETGIVAVDNSVSSMLPAPVVGASVNPMQIWLWLGSYLWLAGIIIMLVYSFVSIFILERRLKGARLTEENTYEADNIKTPFVLGFFKPRIYIPEGLNEEEKSYVLLHERTHIRRYDHIVKIIAYFILCVHWFNPLVWLAFLLMGADMELSCDERVLREMGGDIKKAYSSTLLSFATGRIISGSPLAFSEGGVKTRIKNVLNYKKPLRLVVIISVVIVAVLSVSFAMNKSKPLDWDNIPVGTPQRKVHKAFGEPDSLLSGFSSELYYLYDGMTRVVVYYDANWRVENSMSERQPDEPQPYIILDPLDKKMSLADVRTLAAKGDELTMGDVLGVMSGINIDSGLGYRVTVYGVENDMRLVVREGQIDNVYEYRNSKPESVILESLNTPGDGIDIRYGNFHEFISKWTDEPSFENPDNGGFSIQNIGNMENGSILSNMNYNNAGLNRNEWVEWNELYKYRTPGTMVSMYFELDGSNIFKFESEKNGLIAEMDALLPEALSQENIQTVSSGEKVRGIRSGNCFFLNRDDLKRIGFHTNIDRKTWIPEEELYEETYFNIRIEQDSDGNYKLFSTGAGRKPIYELTGLTGGFMQYDNEGKFNGIGIKCENGIVFINRNDLKNIFGIEVNEEQKAINQTSTENGMLDDEGKAIYTFPQPIKTSLKKTGDEEHLIQLAFSIETQGVAENEIVNNAPVIREAVTELLQSFDYETINNDAGFQDKLSELSVKEINSALGKEVVNDFFISELFIQ